MFAVRRAVARRSILLTAVAPALLLPLLASNGRRAADEPFEGRVPTAAELAPSIEAAFPDQSHAPGTAASLVFFNSAAGVSVRFFQVGREQTSTVATDQLQGVPVTESAWIGTVHPGRAFTVRIGRWPSGVYFARMQSSDGRVGFAPFVLRPRRLGEHRVAVVMPTLTWQAYNLRDDDGDGIGDTWYADWHRHTAGLGRPFLDRGAPPHFHTYDLPFLQWLAANHHEADYLADADLDNVRDGSILAGAYDLIIFPGHHEYVTSREYDAVRRFRDLGGNIAFLSANNFFRRVDVHANRMTLIGQWRRLGRPEAALIGVQYRANDEGRLRAPWTVRRAEAAPWLFAGTGLADGKPLGKRAGIEIDETTSSSPHGVRILADVRNLLGPGLTAQMTYYRTAHGAKVFAAGAFTLAGSARQATVSKILDNLWTYLSRP